MKWNCFDWFDHYAAEKNGVPKLETQPIHTDAIWKRVQEQAGIAPQPKRNRMHMTKWVAGIAAAAVLVTGGTTLVAAAGYGGLDAFFQSLIGEETPKDPEKLAALVTTPAADFDSTNENVQFKLLGMYGDDSQAMLSFQVTAMDGAALQDGLALPYQLLLLDADGGSETLDCYGRTVDVREKDGAYYINLRINHTDLQGKTLDVTFENFYTEAQVSQIWEQLTAYDDQFLQEYVRQNFGEDALKDWGSGELPAGFDVNAWKAYRRESQLAQKCSDREKELYAETDGVISGSWHTCVALDFVSAAPITADFDGGTVNLQELSATITAPAEWDDESHTVDYVITLKDSRKIFDELVQNAEGEEMLRRIHALPGCGTGTIGQYVPLTEVYWDADSVADVLCYSEPIDPSEVKTITAYRFAFAGEASDGTSGLSGYDLTDSTVIYRAQ